MSVLNEYLGDTWRFFWARCSAICSVLFPILIPLNVVFIFADLFFADESSKIPQQVSFFAFSMSLLLYPIYQGALIKYIDSSVNESSLNLKAFYREAATCWSAMITLYAIYLLAMIIGLSFLIIPGLYVIARFSYAEFYCLLEKLSPWDAIAESWKQTEAHQIPLLLGVVLIWLLTTLPVIWLQAAGLDSMLLNFVLALVAAVVATPITIFRFRFYNEFVQKK